MNSYTFMEVLSIVHYLIFHPLQMQSAYDNNIALRQANDFRIIRRGVWGGVWRLGSGLEDEGNMQMVRVSMDGRE